MDMDDITPHFAVNKISSLIETNRIEDCSKFIGRLNHLTIKSILAELPISHLHVNVPQSLCILDAIYKKVYESPTTTFPIQQLRTDELLKNMVILFSRSHSTNNKDKNCNAYFPLCRNILKIVATAEPQFLQKVKEKKKKIDQCLKYLAKHGMVKSGVGRPGYKMLSLHDALKLEFDKVINLYKAAVQKLEAFSLSAKNPAESNVSSGPAPIEASHQRMLQIHLDSIQDRLFKNKTVFNVVEPAVTSKALQNLIGILEKRIEYDKMVLFQELELRKLYSCDKSAYVSVTLRKYSHGYATLMQLIHEACGIFCDGIDDLGHNSSSDEDLYTSHGSVYSRIDIRSVSVNALDEYSGEDNYGRSKRGKFSRISSPLLAGGLLLSNSSRHGSRDNSPIYTSVYQTDKTSTSGEGPQVPVPRVKGATSTLDGIMSSYVKMVETPSSPTDHETVSSLKQEVECLRKEVKQSREEIKRIQEREKSLRDRLSDQVQKQFAVSNHFENLNLGKKRPTELIRLYGNLYTDGRLDALDALDDLKDLEELNVLKTKILFSIIVLSFRSAQELLENTNSRLQETLNIPSDTQPTDSLSLEMKQHIDKYIQQTFDRFILSSNVKNVCDQIFETLYDYPCLRECEGLKQFVEECMHIALGLSSQTPAYIISYSDSQFHRDRHVRFHTSDPGTDLVKNFLWPCLLEGEGGICVSKGFVIT